jgi:hypothetical protein
MSPRNRLESSTVIYVRDYLQVIETNSLAGFFGKEGSPNKSSPWDDYSLALCLLVQAIAQELQLIPIMTREIH